MLQLACRWMEAGERGDLARKDRRKGWVQPSPAAAGLRRPTCPCMVACRSQAALRGTQWQDKSQRSGGSTGKCWLRRQDDEFFLMRVGRDLGTHCLEKLWDPGRVSKFGWIRLWGALPNVEVRPALSRMLELQSPLPNKIFLLLYYLVFIGF